MFGIFGKCCSINTKKLKFYKRFRDIREGDSWYVGRDRWDAITFIPNKPITVYGIGLFEKHPNGGEFQIGYKFYILNSNDN